jgi:hypothetical protein
MMRDRGSSGGFSHSPVLLLHALLPLAVLAGCGGSQMTCSPKTPTTNGKPRLAARI